MLASGINNIEFFSSGEVNYPEKMEAIILAHKSQIQEIFMNKVFIEEQTYLIKNPTDTPGLLGINYKISTLNKDELSYEQISNKLLDIVLDGNDTRAVVYTTKHNMFQNEKFIDQRSRRECYDFLCEVVGIDSDTDGPFSCEGGVIYFELGTEEPHVEYSDVMRDFQIIVDDWESVKTS